MAKVEVVVPSTVRISYRQEKGDHDYGTCLWADFDFDTEKYTLQIMSDCGNYSYGWVPTPQAELFFHLCRRFDAGYLLYKIANPTQIDDEATYAAAVNLLQYYDDLPANWKEELKDDLSVCCNEHEIAEAITKLANTYGIDLDGYEVWCCIEKDYTANAKKIVDVYMKHIVPALPRENNDEYKANQRI